MDKFEQFGAFGGVAFKPIRSRENTQVLDWLWHQHKFPNNPSPIRLEQTLLHVGKLLLAQHCARNRERRGQIRADLALIAGISDARQFSITERTSVQHEYRCVVAVGVGAIQFALVGRARVAGCAIHFITQWIIFLECLQAVFVTWRVVDEIEAAWETRIAA